MTGRLTQQEPQYTGGQAAREMFYKPLLARSSGAFLAVFVAAGLTQQELRSLRPSQSCMYPHQRKSSSSNSRCQYRMYPDHDQLPTSEGEMVFVTSIISSQEWIRLSDAEKKKAQREHQATMCVAGPEGDKPRTLD